MIRMSLLLIFENDVTSIVSFVLWMYLLSEILFYICFHVYMKPKANNRTIPSSFELPEFASTSDRYKIVIRILSRIHHVANHYYSTNNNNQQSDRRSLADIRQEIATQFISGWFHSSGYIPQLAPNMPPDKKSSVMIISDDVDDDDIHCCRSVPLTQESMSTTTSAASSSSHSSEEADDMLLSDQEQEYNTIPFVREGNKKKNNNTITSTSTGTGTTTDSCSTTTNWTIPNISKDDMDEFLCWTLFVKPYSELDSEEIQGLQDCHDAIQKELGLTFYNNNNNNNNKNECGNSLLLQRKSRRLNFECMSALHRPLLVYICIAILQLLGGTVLRIIGFKRITSKATGLQGWYKKPTKQRLLNNSKKQQTRIIESTTDSFSASSSSALIFFHGIAPGGVMVYLPMLFGVLWDQLFTTRRGNNNNQSFFFFETPNISNKLCFSFTALSEEETCMGVYELMEQCIGYIPNNITIMGHSFGSCQVSWMIHSKWFENTNINKVILIDPVSIMLSDPDVMVNFLYNNENGLIRLVAGSELFTEHYLRRRFAWYNSELWLEQDILQQPTNKNLHCIIALSENDSIVNSPKVQEYINICCQKYNYNMIDRFDHPKKTIRRSNSSSIENANSYDNDRNNSTNNNNNKLHVIYWKNAKHADCVTQPSKWQDLRQQIQFMYSNNDNNSLSSYDKKKT